MSVFEPRRDAGLRLDDTMPLTCRIISAHSLQKHTEYSIKVQRGPIKSNCWNVSRRYNEFASLNSALCVNSLPLPPKKIIGNMQPEFIAERRNALQIYLDELMKNLTLSSSLPVKIFLDPQNYSTLFKETALQNVSMALRGDDSFELKTTLPPIGWRIRKQYYLVFNKQTNEGDYIMSWQTYGPNKLLSDRDMEQTFKSLMSLKHPYIDKLIFLHNLEAGAYVVRKLHPGGSLRDVLYGSQYNSPFLIKYANPKQRKPLTVGQIVHYGYQILQALKYLKDRGFPYGHLHPGNIAIDNQNVLLLDIENAILGVPMYYRPYIIEHKKINTLESIDVYSFGHTLYEMAYGEPLHSSTCEKFPSHVSNDLLSILEMILSPKSCKRGMPSIEMLLEHKFFLTGTPVTSRLIINENIQCYLKFTMHIKEELRKVVQVIETRLKSDQKMVRIDKRETRIQEILNSEEEIRKHRRKTKNKENILSRSVSMNGLSPTSTGGPSERSGSVASTNSTASSYTPPQIEDSSNPIFSEPSPPRKQNRSALLDSICSFNKSSLNKIQKS